MMKHLTRTFPIASKPQDLLDLANQPLLATAYLNFLTKICSSICPSRSDPWQSYDVWVQYRSIIKAHGVVEHCFEPSTQTIRLRHDGPFAQFEAAFVVHSNDVQLDCTYVAKLPLITWLIHKTLDRLLKQVAFAMDRYAIVYTSERSA